MSEGAGRGLRSEDAPLPAFEKRGARCVARRTLARAGRGSFRGARTRLMNAFSNQGDGLEKIKSGVSGPGCRPLRPETIFSGLEWRVLSPEKYLSAFESFDSEAERRFS